jgi:hypothetical protein
VPGDPRHCGVDFLRTEFNAPLVRRGEILVFLAAMIGVPLVAALVITHAALNAREPVLHIGLPATIGAALGLLLVGWSDFGKRGSETPPVTGRRELGPIATALIVGAALLGTFSGHLPAELLALIFGWALGLFVAFDLMIARRWRQDPTLRARIRDGVSGSS